LATTFHRQAFNSGDKSRSTLVFAILKGRESYSVYFKHGERIIVRRESCDITLQVLRHQVHRQQSRSGKIGALSHIIYFSQDLCWFYYNFCIYDFSISATSICRVSTYSDMVFLLSIVFLYFIHHIILFM